MSDRHKPHPGAGGHELRFTKLVDPGQALTFPCDAEGHVDLDSLSETARSNYFFARAVVGRDFACPVVRPCELH